MATIEKHRSKDSTIRYSVKIRRRGAPSISETFLRLSDTKTFAHKTEADIAAGRAVLRKNGIRPYLSRIERGLHIDGLPVSRPIHPGHRRAKRSQSVRMIVVSSSC